MVGLDLEGRPNLVMEVKELAMLSIIVGFTDSAYFPTAQHSPAPNLLVSHQNLVCSTMF